MDHVDLQGLGVKADVGRLIGAARAQLSPALLDALEFAVARSRAYNTALVEAPAPVMRTPSGTTATQIKRPLRAAGLFVPVRKGSFPSVLVQIGTPAVVAGVEEVAVVVPPERRWGPELHHLDPAMIVVADLLGIPHLFACNGPAGIAALASGIDGFPRVELLIGPGSPAIEISQQIAARWGCLIQTGLGPSDSLIVAEAITEPAVLAADFVNEAEHGTDSSAVLVSPDRAGLEAVAGEVIAQVAELPEPRRSFARSAITNGGLLAVDDLAAAMDIANDFAPEHLLLLADDPACLLPSVRNAGTVLLGAHSAFAASNYTAGTPATLPTTGAARRTSGITADTFMKRMSVLEMSAADLAGMAPHIVALAGHEGFPAHAAAMTTRFAPSGG